MSRAPRIGGILLAAGRGRRFGTDKRAALAADGRTLLEHAVAGLVDVVDELVLVVGAGDSETVFQARFPRTRVVRAARSEEGMGSSLAAAIVHADSWDGCLVALADKPFVRQATARRVRELLADHPLVVPTRAGRRGHPVGFARVYFPALAAQRGAAGARALIEAEASRALFLETDDPGVVEDIDTPQDLAAWEGAGRR